MSRESRRCGASAAADGVDVFGCDLAFELGDVPGFIVFDRRGLEDFRGVGEQALFPLRDDGGMAADLARHFDGGRFALEKLERRLKFNFP